MKNALIALCCLLTPLMISAQTTVTRDLPAFDKVGISGGYDEVILKAGRSESVSIEIKGGDADDIITEVRDNTLRIKTKKGQDSYKSKAKITITYRSLTAIANSGSSDIKATSVIKADKFEYASSGSGDFSGEFDVQDLKIAISGSSDLSLKGSAENQDIAISGSGDIDAQNLKGHAAKVAISGSGDVRLGVDGKVKTAVSGSGRVSNDK